MVVDHKECIKASGLGGLFLTNRLYIACILNALHLVDKDIINKNSNLLYLTPSIFRGRT